MNLQSKLRSVLPVHIQYMLKNKIVYQLIANAGLVILAVVCYPIMFSDVPVRNYTWVIAGLIGISTTLLLIFTYSSPPAWVNKYYYYILGFVMMFVIIFFGDFLHGEPLQIEVFDVVFFLVLGIPLGFYMGDSFGPVKWRKLQKIRGFQDMEKPVLRDEATMKTPEGDFIKGELILTKEKILFIQYRKWQFLMDKPLVEIEPSITHITRFRIPDGLNLTDNDYVFQVSFPKFWMKKIEKMKSVI